jgi:hypothetical protein
MQRFAVLRTNRQGFLGEHGYARVQDLAGGSEVRRGRRQQVYDAGFALGQELSQIRVRGRAVGLRRESLRTCTRQVADRDYLDVGHASERGDVMVRDESSAQQGHLNDRVVAFRAQAFLCPLYSMMVGWRFFSLSR